MTLTQEISAVGAGVPVVRLIFPADVDAGDRFQASTPKPAAIQGRRR